MFFCSFHERVNDCVLKVNNTDLTNVEYCTAVQAISRGDVINMVSEIVDAVNYNKYNFKALLLVFFKHFCVCGDSTIFLCFCCLLLDCEEEEVKWFPLTASSCFFNSKKQQRCVWFSVNNNNCKSIYCMNE